MEFKIGWSGRAFDYTDEEVAIVTKVMRQADPLTQGKYQAEFEQKFGAYHGLDNCFAVNNCTNALDLVALLSGAGPGDEIIIPAHTFCATAVPFLRTRAKIVWADIDPNTWVVSADSIRANLTSRTKLIVAVHLYGLMADMDAIMRIARDNGIRVLEDCAQALGASAHSKKAGTYGDFSVFSFHAQKNVTLFGEGGMISVRIRSWPNTSPGCVTTASVRTTSRATVIGSRP